jgi:hypothetical protein
MLGFDASTPPDADDNVSVNIIINVLGRVRPQQSNGTGSGVGSTLLNSCGTLPCPCHQRLRATEAHGDSDGNAEPDTYDASAVDG